MHEEGHALATLPGRTFPAAHTRVVVVILGLETNPAGRSAVVGHVDENRILGDTDVLQVLAELAQVLVNIGNHAVELGECLRHLGVSLFEGIRILVGHDVGAVRRVGGKVEEEGLVLVGLGELGRLLEPDISAVSLERLPAILGHVVIVVVVVAPVVGTTTNTAVEVINGMIKTLIQWSTRVTCTQMPLAQHASHEAIGFEDLR